MIGPALVLAIFIGIFHTGLYVTLRGTAGGRLPLVLLGAVLGAWAGDALGARVGLDPVRIGDVRVLSASLVAWVGIGFVTIVATLGPSGRTSP